MVISGHCRFQIRPLGVKPGQHQSAPDVAIVRMDIIRPEMDSIGTMEVIRARPGHLPIVALTAKAMNGESREISGSGSFRLLGEKPFNLA